MFTLKLQVDISKLMMQTYLLIAERPYLGASSNLMVQHDMLHKLSTMHAQLAPFGLPVMKFVEVLDCDLPHKSGICTGSDCRC